ncbi:MAG: MAPEG family protein [Gammaproteobacteria bacterium]|nr:MAPEG family protein [Gammaproteobacteria bacterium]
MTIAYWCVLVAIFIPLLFAGLAKSRGDFDNARPRRWLEQTEGWRQRAHWAQLNSYEAFAPFAAGVIIAHLAEAPQAIVNVLAVAFVLLRLGFGAAYLADRPTVRTLFWTGAFACVVGLFIVAGIAST